MKNGQFPMPDIEDKMPKTIAETVASTVSTRKAASGRKSRADEG